MSYIKLSDWQEYIERLRLVNEAAAEEMRAYVRVHGFGNEAELIQVAHEIATKYGEAAASATCDMYDAIAQFQGVNVKPAEPAAMSTLEEVRDTLMSALERAPSTIDAETGKLVKKTSTRTMRKNAARDGAQMALIPGGDGCPFCMMLASRGWESARKDSSFDAHLHKNCQCEYAVRFNGDLNVQGYDPDAIYNEFIDTGARTWNGRMNAMRRANYSKNKDMINAQKRTAYQRRKEQEANK